jgi:hypothetical protein
MRLRTLTPILALMALTAAAAQAAESPHPPRHTVDYRVDWIDFIAPEDLPPSRYAVCLVDSGLAVTPDAPVDSSAGPVLERLAVDGGSGEPQGNDRRQLHGTRMAMAAIAPVNGWGTIGTWPAGRLISVRAMVAGETSFRGSAYRIGINACVRAADRHPIAAINLSLGCDCGLSADERLMVEDQVGRAHKGGISVVAAAGNTPGGPTQEPATVPGVIAVGGGGAGGQLCAQASFDDRVDVLAPGCAVDRADPLSGEPLFDDGGGSSMAAAVTSTLLALLRTLRPHATQAQAEAWLRDSARSVDGRRVLDGEAAARLAGLSAVVDRARGRMPPPTPADPTAASQASAEPPSVTVPSSGGPPGSGIVVDEPTQIGFSRPHVVRAHWRRGRLVLRVSGRPRFSSLRLIAEYLRDDFRVHRAIRTTRASSFLTLRLRRRPDQLRVLYVPAARDHAHRNSLPVLLRAARAGRFR